jgi:hypothetical protein
MEKYKYFLIDFVSILLDKINNLKQEPSDDFNKGISFAYYDIITILKEQANIFEIKLEEINLENINENIILQIGEKNNRKQNAT